MNNLSNKNKTIALLLCFFLGYFGVHRFYLGKKTSGIVWLCTVGLFGIGWIADLFILAKEVFADSKSHSLFQRNVPHSSTHNSTANTLNSITPPVSHQENFNSMHIQTSSSNGIIQQNTTNTFTPVMSPVTPQVNVQNIAEPKQRKQFTLNEAISVYFCTDHWSCKSIYDFKLYFQDAFDCILKNIKQCEIILSNERVLRQKEIRNPISETKNITKATNINKIKNFVVVDTETTGLKCGGNDIVEICAIKFIDFKPTEKFHTYLKPRKPIPPEASNINGITDEMVANAPQFSNIKSSLQEFIGDYPIVAHNAPFDIKFLHVSGLDLESHVNKVYDTLHLARLKLRYYDGSKYDSYKLRDLCEEQNIACQIFHSADSDTLACGILFVDIVKKVNEVKNIDELL